MRKLFGKDGVRGVANVEPITVETAMKLGRAAAHIFKHKEGRHRIVIGKDTRLSCYMIESALTSGMCSLGVDVILVGPLPTPAVAFMARSLRVDAAVMISASHNSFQDNGIKFFSKEGFKLPDQVEHQIEDLLFSGEIDEIRPTAKEIGKVFRLDDVEGRYIEFVKRSLPKDLDLVGLKVVVDCANGASYKVAPTVLQELGADVIPLNNHPNGTNINANCGSMHPEGLQKAVIEHKAHVGIALDGDADRSIFVNEKGEVVHGDALLVTFALAMQEDRRLKGETLVTTLMSNMGVELALNPKRIHVLRTQVGDRYVIERMLNGAYNLGGEQSGHLIFLDYNTTGGGVITALQFLALMVRSGKSVSDLTNCMTPLPQVLKNVRVKQKRDLAEIPEIQQKITDCEQKLGAAGRILVRYSGTELLLRIMIEGEDGAVISEMAETLAAMVQKKIGAEK